MKNKRFFTTLSRSVITTVIASYSVLACAHQAHVHGQGQLNVAQEAQHVMIEFESPLMNLVGFEHSPEDAQEAAKLAVARTTLANTQLLFHFEQQAGCQLEKFDIQMPQQDEREHKAVTHLAVNKTVGPDEHEHSDVDVSYAFTCTNPEYADHFNVLLFDVFSRLQKIQVQWLTANHQGSVELTPNSHQLALN